MPYRGLSFGGVAQLARALGSYPSCHRFESSRRYHPEEAAPAPPLRALKTRARFWAFGPLVKRLRHRPFTAVTRVRVPYGSPIWRLSSAGRALASHARGHRFEFCSLHHKKPWNRNGFRAFFFSLLLRWRTCCRIVSGHFRGSWGELGAPVLLGSDAGRLYSRPPPCRPSAFRPR